MALKVFLAFELKPEWWDKDSHGKSQGRGRPIFQAKEPATNLRLKPRGPDRKSVGWNIKIKTDNMGKWCQGGRGCPDDGGLCNTLMRVL